MSDPASAAKTARESLSKGLSVLQTDPSLPPNLKGLAEPIALAMGALMQIERSNGSQLVPHAQVALDNVRGALSHLQQFAANPAVGKAMEPVAASLGLIHTLGKLAGVVQAPPAAAPQQQYQQPPQQQFQQPPQPQYQQAPPQQQARPAPQVSGDPFGNAPTALQQPAVQQAPHNPAVGAPLPPAAAGIQSFNADLGAQSPTNFYKGLSGNDIIDHGGLFVSTYMIPKIGTPIRLRVSLPGGYEFDADAVVRWSREANADFGDSPPGFGAQFVRISPEAKQLIYRYVRNREPLFHDDL